MKKIRLLPIVFSTLFVLSGCKEEYNAPLHTCSHGCSICFKCTDLDCPDTTTCKDKCYGHEGIEVQLIARDQNVESIKVYTTRDLTSLDTNEKIYARNGSTGEVDLSGEGEINFVIRCKEGYTVDEVTVDRENNEKVEKVSQNGLNCVYRVSNIPRDIVVYISSKELPVHECAHVCKECGKCKDKDCKDPKCANKCECPPPEYSYHKKFNSQENVALVDSPEFTEFWNYSSDIQMNLDFKENAFKTMCELQGKSLPKFADVYFPADLKIKMNDKEYTFEEVGVRLKGNTSRRSMLDSSGKISRQAHMKVSLKATFDDELYDKDPKVAVFKKTWDDANARKERKDRTLFGMEKFDLKYVTRNSGFGGGFGGSGSDGCFAREVVSFDMFRKQGMLAPNANICQVTLSNEVSTNTFRYQTIECVDKVFLKRHFSKADAKGDLYKCGVQDHWIADFQRRKTVEEIEDENGKAIGGRIANGWIGVEDPYNQYFPSYQLKTNDDLGEGSDFSKMTTLINTLTDCLNNKGSKEELEKVLNMDQFLEYSAISYMLGNFDDLRYNTNNSYVYFVPSTGKAVVIAYDYDWSLGLATGKDMSKVKPFDTYTMSGNISNLYKATLLNDSDIGLALNYSKKDYQDRFLNYMSDALDNNCLNPEYLYSIVDQFKYVGTTFPKERTNVASYMEKKTATILDALKN